MNKPKSNIFLKKIKSNQMGQGGSSFKKSKSNKTLNQIRQGGSRDKRKSNHFSRKSKSNQIKYKWV